MNAVINRNFSPSDVEWSIVSGPGTVVRGEDDFGSADWTATVAATAESGEVIVEARFNEDAIQPRFVLPIVQQRMLPVKAFVVNENDRPIASAESIQSKIDYANVIPSGSIYSLRKKARSSNETFSSKAGANFIKPNIMEVYSR